MADAQQTGSVTRRQFALAALMLIWFLVAAGVILWQTVAYRGIAAAAAEWEYARFGRYFPWATLLFLIALFSLPPLYFLFRRERLPEGHVATLPEVQSRGLRFLRQLTISAIACLGAGLVSLALVLTLPSNNGSPVRIDTLAAGEPAIGPAIVSGRIRYDRIATLDRYLLLTKRSFRFAPVEPAAGSTLRYFVEIDTWPEAGDPPVARQGVLRKGGLPGEIIQLYHGAGYAIASPHYVLFASPNSMRWPFYVVASHFFLTAFLLGCAALIQRRKNTRTKRDWRQSGATL